MYFGVKSSLVYLFEDFLELLLVLLEGLILDMDYSNNEKHESSAAHAGYLKASKSFDIRIIVIIITRGL